MPDESRRFSRQAEWQRRRAKLPWPVKIRMAEAMREGLVALRARKPGPEPRGDIPRTNDASPEVR